MYLIVRLVHDHVRRLLPPPRYTFFSFLLLPEFLPGPTALAKHECLHEPASLPATRYAPPPLPVTVTVAACPNAFLYENPVCLSNSTLHIGDRSAGERSCSYCDCQEGWGGVDCGRCSDVSVCPDINVNGTVS